MVKLDKRNVNSYFHKALKFLYQNNGIVFVKYKKQHTIKLVCLAEGYTISITGSD
ncbi:MAG: hypothetical protein ACLUFR_08225 [Megamonas funiformis]|uniref:hypothetical protein n=1 Tax=Megamonas funiformis TaxID=437897 RepID=UPI0039916593